MSFKKINVYEDTGEGESKEVEAVFHQIWFEKHKGLVLICQFNLVSLVLLQVPNVDDEITYWIFNIFIKFLIDKCC
ncbi:unnamed protein product [Lactuca virosa]|uniref:Uncharacterized protein n=1 Tax=Lactuca virosa TaxID=75947 RepID=A0AAU9NFF2_9ASTR|nr:unnamed protein product [Lactuca virosa]